MTTNLATRQNGAVAATIVTDDGLPSQRLMDFCEVISKSNLVPNDFRGRPADILIAVQMGTEVGLKPIQALHSIAVINGRPSLWGDGALAVVRARPDCEDVRETIEGKNDDRTATCTVVRAAQTPVTRAFSVLDAKRAKLFDKDGPWKQYPDRMLQMRARGFALRDAFPDALKGFAIAEEAMDIPPEPTSDVQQAAQATRTAQVLDKLKAAAAPSAAAPEPQAATAPDETPEPANPEEEKQKARDLRNAIARAWQHIDPTVRASILGREYAKGALTELSIGQLSDFLERTPSLLPEPVPGDTETPAE